MDNLLETLKQLLSDPQMQVDASWTDAMMSNYSYMPLPAMLELQRNSDSLTDRRRATLSQHIALTASSPLPLHRIVHADTPLKPDFYPEPERPATPDTEQAIDKFISNYCTSQQNEEEILERMIFNPAPDYSQLLAEEEERSVPEPEQSAGNDQDSLINAFILKSRRQGHFPSSTDKDPKPEESQPTPAEEPKPHSDESLLSESLAKIYIKQRRYKRAYEIISNISLKYPEKSVYFADQLRFLQKLIINQQYNQIKNN
ncbi:MAG: hypothetical protein NC343_05615 [Muribaculum sp.]|nr:hypothetical protein [Muribaculaceae bacterium]MCM1081209.1 hypothetical protein [Muribaculum sp.]